MSLDDAVPTGRTGGSNDGGPTRATRTVVATVAIAAVALAVLAGAGVAGAASADAVTTAADHGEEPHANVTFSAEPSNERPVLDHTVQQFPLGANETVPPDGSDLEDLTFDWSVDSAASGELEPENTSNGESDLYAVYDVSSDDAGNVLTFTLEVTDEATGQTDTDQIEVEIEAAAPTAVVSYGGSEENRDIYIEEDTDEVIFSGTQSSDLQYETDELNFTWSVEGDIAGTFEPFSEGDRYARLEPNGSDADRTFDVSLVVENGAGLRDEVSVTVNPEDANDGDGGGAPLVMPSDGSGDSTPDSAPAESSFEIDSVDTPSDVEAGDDVEVTLAIENTGDADGTASVDVDIGDAATETVELDVPAGESRETTATVSAPEEAGDYDLSVGTQDDQGSYALSVDDATVTGGGSSSDDTDSSTDESSFGLSSLLGAVFILALVGVAARRFVA